MQLSTIMQPSNSSAPRSAAFGNFSPFCQGVPGFDVCNLFFHRLTNNKEESEKILLPSCQVKVKGQDGGKGNIALAAVSSFVIILTLFMCMRVFQRKQASGRREMLFFICTYFATLPLQIITMGSFLPNDSAALSIVTSFRLALCSAIFWSLISVGLVLAGVLRSGGTVSILFLTASYLASFILALCLCLDTAFGIFKKGDLSAAELVNRPFLFADLLVIPIVSFLLYLILVTINFARSKNWKPFVWTLLSGGLWVASQMIQLLGSLAICQYTDSKVDGSFLSVGLQALSVWSLLRAHWSLTEDEGQESSSGSDPDPDSDEVGIASMNRLKREQSSTSSNDSKLDPYKSRGRDGGQIVPGSWNLENQPNGTVQTGWKSGWSIARKDY